MVVELGRKDDLAKYVALGKWNKLEKVKSVRECSCVEILPATLRFGIGERPVSYVP